MQLLGAKRTKTSVFKKALVTYEAASYWVRPLIHPTPYCLFWRGTAFQGLRQEQEQPFLALLPGIFLIGDGGDYMWSSCTQNIWLTTELQTFRQGHSKSSNVLRKRHQYKQDCPLKQVCSLAAHLLMYYRERNSEQSLAHVAVTFVGGLCNYFN